MLMWRPKPGKRSFSRPMAFCCGSCMRVYTMALFHPLARPHVIPTVLWSIIHTAAGAGSWDSWQKRWCITLSQALQSARHPRSAGGTFGARRALASIDARALFCAAGHRGGGGAPWDGPRREKTAVCPRKLLTDSHALPYNKLLLCAVADRGRYSPMLSAV